VVDIKIKESKKGTIKSLNKAVVGTEKIKNRITDTKEKVNENTSQEKNTSGTNYAVNKVSNEISNTPYNIKKLNKLNQYGKENFIETRENINIANQKIKYAKKRNHAKKVVKNMVKGSRQAKSTIKTAEQTSKKAIKTAERTGKTVKVMAKNTTKVSKRALQLAKETATKTAKSIKIVVKATISAIKATIAGTKALIAALIAGGWIVLIIVIVICLIAMLCSSVFGIFFSSEDVGSTITVNGVQQSVTMTTVISDLNKEFMKKITEIQQSNPHDEYDITSNRTSWKDILTIYTVKVSGGNNTTEVMTLDDNKINILKEIFWDMNEINFTKDEESHEEINSTEHTTVTYTKLHIIITSKTAIEMADIYNFNQEQRNQLAELLKEDYASMWASVIYGSNGSSDIVKVALSEIGNIGGQPYWSWYGFESRVEWCACFVSWCANECGYIENGIIPKFANCQLEGVDWFKACGLWQDGGYTPKPGDIIFFDWADKHDGSADHVGIVEKVENGRVYTIEGNSNDTCKQKNYDINSTEIQGYGTPMY
jgi:hypothetical protein